MSDHSNTPIEAVDHSGGIVAVGDVPRGLPTIISKDENLLGTIPKVVRFEREVRGAFNTFAEFQRLTGTNGVEEVDGVVDVGRRDGGEQVANDFALLVRLRPNAASTGRDDEGENDFLQRHVRRVLAVLHQFVPLAVLRQRQQTRDVLS